MNRREFLKGSLASLVMLSIEANPTIKNTILYLDPNSPDVLLYLIKNNKGQWKVRGTKWVDAPKRKLNPDKVDVSTFKVLEVVPNAIANKRKNQLWVKYNCSGEKGGPLNVVTATKRAYNAHKSPKMKEYLNSKDFDYNWNVLGKKSGGSAWGKVLGKRNVETGWLESIRPTDCHFKSFTKEEMSEYGRRGGLVSAKINLESGQVHMAQKLAAKSRRKKVICTETDRIWDSLKQCAIDNDLHYGSLKNKLIENGRKNTTSFRYADDYLI